MYSQPPGGLDPAAGQQSGSPTASCTRALLSPPQRHMPSDCLQDRPSLLWQLDPSHDPRPEVTYRSRMSWFVASDERIRLIQMRMGSFTRLTSGAYSA